jgi:hypothetical protein
LDMPASLDCPTEFPRPFRSYAAASLVPPPIPPVTANLLLPAHEVDATLLRQGAVAGQPLFNFASALDCNNTDRNPFFRYQGIERLNNLVTTRSNVYAVWITVGYFEVEPAAKMLARVNPGWNATQIQTYIQAAQARGVYLDGYTLGRELGTDTGQIERHRAFYIFDRTIPVGFQRGQDLNVDKAILINRVLE